MTITLAPEVAVTRNLNDRLRRCFIGGQIMITAGVQAKGPAFRCACVAAVMAYEDFTEGNDPHGDHDFGALTVEGFDILWKVDCYDRFLESASPDPADPAVTTRVLTILMADEY